MASGPNYFHSFKKYKHLLELEVVYRVIAMPLGCVWITYVSRDLKRKRKCEGNINKIQAIFFFQIFTKIYDPNIVLVLVKFFEFSDVNTKNVVISTK